MQSLIKIAAVIILGVSLFGFWSNLPNGDLAAIFDQEAVQQAMTNGQMNLLLLVLFSFGIGASSNYLLTSIGITQGYGDAVGRGVVAVWFVLVIGGLVVGVISNFLKGITVPAVMNPGTGLLIGSLIGLLMAKNLK
ncbi:MAG: hypothetical protein K8L97_20995 [Anaerolineae bacterium]|nr:hypothetical protein [Anaerolineae bacterium]